MLSVFSPNTHSMLWSLGSSGKKSGVHVTPTRLLNEICEGLANNFIRLIPHFKDKVSSHLFGRLEQAVTMRMSILFMFMLQLLSHSTGTTQLTFHSVSPWPPPGLFNYWALWIPCTSLATGNMGTWVFPLLKIHILHYRFFVWWDVYGVFLSSSCKV